MKYICAYILCALSETTPTKQAVQKALESVGAEVDQTELTRVFDLVKGKQLHELMNAGVGKLATFSAAPSAGASTAQPTTGGAPEKKEAAKKEEKKKVEEEEEVDLGGGGLFGDDDDF